MGIRGLKNYLVSKLDGVLCTQTLPAGGTLVVDGDGWVFQLIETCEGFRSELGGCYEAYDKAIGEEIERLRSCGLQILVYFDGPDQRFKSHTAQLRDEQREEQWAKFFDFCEEGAKHTAGDSFPLPPLCKRQLLASLKARGIAVTTSPGEADQDIAKFVCQNNAAFAVGEELFFAYGRDSDYIAMKGCAYIEFGSITHVVSQQETPNSLRMRSTPTKASLLRQQPLYTAQAKVWRRAEVCEALSLTEAQFLDWVVWVGNDYTGGHCRAEDFNLPAPSDHCEGHSVSVLNALLTAVMEAGGDSAQLRAKDATATDDAARVSELAALQVAIEYSRAVYELQPLSAFPLDQDDNIECVSEPDNSNNLFDFSKYDHGEGFFSDVHQYVASCGKKDSQRMPGIAEHAVLYLRHKLSSTNNESDGQDKDIAVTAEQLVALEVMLRQINLRAEISKQESAQQATELSTPGQGSEKKNKGKSSAKQQDQPLVEASFPHRPRWLDAVAAFVFQKACVELHRALPQDAYRGKYNTPLSCYHGVLFHRILMDIKKGLIEGIPRNPTAAVPGSDLSAPAHSNTAAEGGAAAAMSLSDAMRLLTLSASTQQPTQQQQALPVPPAEAPAAAPAVPPAAAAAVPAKSDVLPIDAFREEILMRIARDRVTIIHGETGCGKSSCLPKFLLEHAEATGQHCQVMVSQPRRIAVTSLLRRLRQTLGYKVGMRMGHGIKDETKETKIHYVTTGYLVRALAHQPDRFKKCTHLIIDEVHERSVDGDLVCLLARDLLRVNPTIRVVLMSATIHTSLYRDYFKAQDDGTYGDMECLSVGVRRFPVDIKYAEDLLSFGSSARDIRERAAASHVQTAAKDIVALTKNAAGDVPQKLALSQYKAAVNLVRAVGVEGTGILIFVSGINDITEIVQLLEPYPKYLVFPIHSDIPADEQELAFGVTPPDKVKVVVATNAAESSVTIPDCDVVICLGTHKSLQYSALNHRTQLVNTWISKASSTQRAGRTGRVRPGAVYRLYSKALFEGMHDHEVAEVHRRPLQDVLLSMWVMLEDAVGFQGVTPFLQGLIEAPDMRNIAQSYQYLYESDLITDPSDDGYLTAMGRLSGELPVDIALGRMIAYGVMLGVAAEAIVLAAALSLPKAPFRYANPIYSDPEEYNAIVCAKFLTAVEFDCGTYSEPIALLRLLCKWRTLEARRLPEFCAKRGLLQAVMKQFKSMSDHLAHTVSTRMKGTEIYLDEMQEPDESKLNILRMILLWSSSGNVLRMQGKAKKKITDTSVLIHSNEVTDKHMRDIFAVNDVPYQYSLKGKRVYDARVAYWESGNYFHSLVQLLDNMSLLAELHSVECYWVTVKSDSDRSTLVALAIPSTDKGEETLQMLCHHVFPQPGRISAGGPIAAAILAQSKFIEDTTVYVVPDASKSELKRLNDFRDLLDVTLSILIPVLGNSKLTASNCCPGDEYLQELFFGDAELPAAEKKIACQVTNSRSVLTFPEDEYDPEYENKPLIDDLPLGHRMISCCQQQVGKTRNKHLVLLASEGSSVKQGIAVAVPGSIEYAKQQLKKSAEEVKAQEGAAVLDRVDINKKLEVKIGAAAATWINIRALKTTPSALNQEDQHMLKSINAILPRQSMLSCSLHRGTETLFAVTHSTLVLGAGGDLVACEGVSFLPPGPNWLYLALLCAGADGNQLADFCPGDELRVHKKKAALANKVSELFRGANAIVPREDIVELVDEIFLPADGDSLYDSESDDFSQGEEELKYLMSSVLGEPQSSKKQSRKDKNKGKDNGSAKKDKGKGKNSIVSDAGEVPQTVQQDQAKKNARQLKHQQKAALSAKKTAAEKAAAASAAADREAAATPSKKAAAKKGGATPGKSPNVIKPAQVVIKRPPKKGAKSVTNPAPASK